MEWWSCLYFLANIFLVTTTTTTTTDIGHIRTLDAQQDERIRLECIVTSKLDAEEAMWMRIRSPHNPDILTYRDSVVYAPDRIQLDQRRLSSSINANGTLIDTYFLTLIILRPNMEDEGRYICSRGKNVFAEYDLFIIVPPQFVDDNSFIQQRTVIEGSTLHLSCSANGQPKPSITWFYRTTEGKHISLGDGTSCQETVCELRLGNYSRNDPTLIECVADNQKSTRISKVFNVDVHYAPKILTNVRALTGSRSIDVLLQCSSIANPPATILWLDENKEKIDDHQRYNIKITNRSSSLSFSLFPPEHSPVIFYCRSNNFIGIDEKLINIADFIQFDSIVTQHSTTNQPSTLTTIFSFSPSKKFNSARPNRARSRSSTSTKPTSTSQISSSSNSVLSSFPLILFPLCFCIKSSFEIFKSSYLM